MVAKVCRTCSHGDARLYNALDSPAKEHPAKTLNHLLLELTQLEDVDRLPQWLCGRCTRELTKAYGFVQQARQNQEDWLRKLSETLKPLTTDCLREKPIQLGTEEGNPVKAEELPKAESAPLCSKAASLDPLLQRTESLACVGDVFDELDEMPLEQRYRNAMTKKLYKCDQCDKSYKYLVCLIKHTHKTHNVAGDKKSSQESKTSRRKSHKERHLTDFDLQRCKPNGCKLIKCMICLRKFAKLSELRVHLQTHPTDIAFEKHGQTVERIAEGFYRDALETTTAGLKQRILNDLKLGNFGRYCSITNQAGLEMSLDSSDTDSDAAEDRSYACDLCESSSWPRKYLLHEHHRLRHSWLEAPHVCHRCNARFLNAQLLAHHLRTLCRNSQKRYRCKKCPQRFFWQHNLRAHLLEHKNNRQIVECEQCSRSFEDQRSFTRHQRIQHDVETELIPCRWCNRSFYRLALLQKHLLRHGFTIADMPLAETLLKAASSSTQLKTITCKLCDVQFASRADLLKHFAKQPQTHNELCGSNYSIATAEGFELQLEDTDSDDNEIGSVYTCELCQVLCRSSREMNEHQRSIHAFDKLPYACEHCIFKSVNQSILEQHLQSQCLNDAKKFSCPHCGYKFMWAENLELHVATHQPSNSSNQPADVELSSGKRKRQHQCPHCVRSFVVMPSLEKHIRDMHLVKRLRNDKNNYLCSLCGLRVISPSKLAIHMRRHTGEKPFQCDLCDSSFAAHYEMKIHRRKHTGERPFPCSVCSKHFSRPDKLKRHVLTHSIKA